MNYDDEENRDPNLDDIERVKSAKNIKAHIKAREVKL